MDCQISLSIINSQSLLKLMSIGSVTPSNDLILCCPLLLLPSIFPSINVFSDESALHIRWPNYRGFSLSTSTSKEYSGLSYFRIDWLDLLAVHRTLKSLLQHHSSKASILRHSNFLVVMYGCESWTIKKAECQRIDAFELWCWRRLLRVLWTARRSNQTILKQISPGCSLEGLMLKLTLQYLAT